MSSYVSNGSARGRRSSVPSGYSTNQVARLARARVQRILFELRTTGNWRGVEPVSRNPLVWPREAISRVLCRAPEWELMRPHAVVESSPGKWHVYWKLSDCGLDTFKRLQQALNVHFNGDPKVCDLPRVLRLPGFLHQKDQPFLSRLVEAWDGPAYTVSEVTEKLELTLSRGGSQVAKEVDPDAFHDRFKGTLPPSLMLIASGRVPSSKGFNSTAIQLVTAAQTAGVNENKLVELCQPVTA